MIDWPEKTLGEICTKITDGAHNSPTSVDDGMPMASVKDLNTYGISLISARHIAQDDYDKLVQQGCKPLVGDVLIAKDGNSALDTVCVQKETMEVVLLSSVAILRPNKEEVLPDYLKYYFSDKRTIDYLKSNFISGAAIPRVVLKDFKKAKIKLPTVVEQKAIASILGALDDKIELNRRMNETLESMARAIFKSWFIDFDPVRAKMEGKQPYGMDAKTAALFPDRLVDSELGLIPGGWEVMTLDRIADIVDCLHSKKPEEQETGPILLQVWNVGKNGRIDLTKCYSITDSNYTIWKKRFEVTGGDLVITKTGRVGAVGRMPVGRSAAMGRNMVGLRAKAQIRPEFLAEYLTNSSARAEINRNTNDGTILASLHVKAVKLLRCVVPDREIMNIASEQLNPIHRMQEKLDFESQTLAELRDLLLPKLLSGEIRIKEAEQLIEELV